MKKTLSIILLSAMLIGLGLCPSVTAYAGETVPMPGAKDESLPFGTGYVGQVSEIEGYIVTLTLVSLEAPANMPNSAKPEPPEGDMQIPQGGGQPPEGDMQMSGGYQYMSDTSIQQSEEKGRMPEGSRDHNGFDARAEGAEPGMGLGGAGFVPGDETMSFDLENALISRQSEKGTEDCAFEDIVLGDILVIETDENDKALSALIISPTENGEAPPEKPEDTV